MKGHAGILQPLRSNEDAEDAIERVEREMHCELVRQVASAHFLRPRVTRDHSAS